MALVETLEEAELAFAINYSSEVELIALVDEIFDANPELWGEAELAELVTLNRKQRAKVARAPGLLRQYLVRQPVTADQRRRSLEECARALLKARLQRYQLSSDLPMTVCQMVHAIETRFDYPDWLGDLYNVCDWCENNSSRDEFPGVRQEAERLEKLL